MTVTVLGTEYSIVRVDFGQDELVEKMHYGGYCSEAERKIVILNLKSTPEWENGDPEAIAELERRTLRHELIHAFLNESGLTWNSFVPERAWAKNEEMVDWIAVQFPKILKAFQDTKAL